MLDNDTSLICNSTQLNCFEQHQKQFNDEICKCYPPCNDITYDFEVQKLPSDWNFNIDRSGLIMKVVANFKDDNFYPQVRRKYFTTIDWFSFIGGILGLFFGFSFISGFEITFHALMGVFG